MNPQQIQAALSNLSNWQLIDDKKIEKLFKFTDFNEAMQFVNKTAIIAEEIQHHPDISIHYNEVTINLWTHSIGGLSEKDFQVAQKIDEL